MCGTDWLLTCLAAHHVNYAGVESGGGRGLEAGVDQRAVGVLGWRKARPKDIKFILRSIVSRHFDFDSISCIREARREAREGKTRGNMTVLENEE